MAPAAVCLAQPPAFPPPLSLKRAPHAWQELYKAERGRRRGQRSGAEPRRGEERASLSESRGSEEEEASGFGTGPRVLGAPELELRSC